MSGDIRDVVFEERGALGIIRLNRPKALNALTREMCVAIRERLAAWRDSPPEQRMRALRKL
ncbi:MAG: enoyl-CoA hydratase/isomerase family protein, partial [Rhodothalassiaceae bacterium]